MKEEMKKFQVKEVVSIRGRLCFTGQVIALGAEQAKKLNEVYGREVVKPAEEKPGNP